MSRVMIKSSWRKWTYYCLDLLKRHHDCMWLDAGCLIAPNGKKILFVGRSGAGKSTTTMALALAYDWKVIAEDILLIDIHQNRLITFGGPFSLKEGTLELLWNSIGRVPDPILNGEWSPLGAMAAPTETEARFDFAIVLFAGSAMSVSPISSIEFLRNCLPLSNILRITGAGEKLVDYVSAGSCLEIEGGTLKERLNFILSLVDGIHTAGP